MIEEAWKDYEAHVIPADAPPVQRVESKRAFYAGAGALFALQLTHLEPGTEPTEKDLAMIDQLHAELDAFWRSALEQSKAEADKAAVPPRFEVSSKRPDMGALDPVCNKTGCGKPTRWQVALVFFAAGYTKPHQGLRTEFQLALCEDCGQAAKVEDFLTDEGFARICEAVKGIGKLPPERGLTKIELLPIFKGRA